MRRPVQEERAHTPAREQEPCRDTAPCVVRVRLWPEEYDRVCKAARAEGATVKGWALRVVLGAVK